MSIIGVNKINFTSSI